MAKLNGGTLFSVIDLKDAYLQMRVHPESQKYLVIATHRGYFRYKRLPFGLSFAPALFQRTMEQVLAGVEGVAVYIDDIIVTGCDEQQHMERLHIVLSRLKAAGVQTRTSKCKFICKSVTYLGHRIDADGINPTEERIEAIKKMPMPSNVHELRSFLGAVNYYSKFVPGLQTLCVPLLRLTRKGAPWTWKSEDAHLVTLLKRILSSSDTLVHYDDKLPLILATDACETGVGAVLSHLFPSGEERPIAFASRTLTDAEKKYATIDKEALAIVFGVTKFSQYLFGRRFVLKTDHKPLERIFGEKREVPKMATNRLTRWALILSAYTYEVHYVPAKENAPADALSRLAIQVDKVSNHEKQPSGQLLNLRLQNLPVTKKELKRELIRDEELSKVIAYMERGWPEKPRLPTELACSHHMVLTNHSGSTSPGLLRTVLWPHQLDGILLRCSAGRPALHLPTISIRLSRNAYLHCTTPRSHAHLI
ncbi:hypothetical protein M514_25341 [Trichuris suis]|uniref:RNA-directed DNA polymerase n=1 Tax=Trichuris suis TaxID=68888 RepID=A0A085MZ45_9BILA|nr:hypothetical protein M514_25341 [Trichuris suis]